MPKAKAFLLRLIYAVICFALFWWLIPMFLDIIGLNPPGNIVQFLKVISGLLALLYVVFGPAEPPYPF